MMFRNIPNRGKNMKPLFPVLAAFGLVAAAGTAEAQSVLDKVIERGTLNCGTDNTSPGFGYLNTTTGAMEGFDVDQCRAVAAAVLGDAEKVNFVVVTDKSRFTAVQTGQVDVVFAHTTILPARESAITVDFLPITFWDGAGAMVKTDLGVGSFDELDGAVLCTTQGSGTEATIAGILAEKGWQNEVLTYENLEKLFGAFSSDRCNVMMTDKSALASWRGNSPDPAAYTILPETLGKSPFGGFVAPNDSRWRNALRWISYGLIEAEERGITSQNHAEVEAGTSANDKKFLGIEGSFGPDFGLPATFMADAIAQVGNYAEIYDRNIGPETPYSITRPGTLNALARDGGVLISPLWE